MRGGSLHTPAPRQLNTTRHPTAPGRYKYALVGDDRPAEDIGSYFADLVSKDYSWADAEWLLGEWSGPTLLKGVVRPDDAERALRAGFDAVWISNHGGRQLETSPAPLDVLPSIRERVGPDATIILDGGVQVEHATRSRPALHSLPSCRRESSPPPVHSAAPTWSRPSR